MLSWRNYGWIRCWLIALSNSRVWHHSYYFYYSENFLPWEDGFWNDEW